MIAAVLIIDDERHVRTLLEHTLDALEDLGIELLSTDSAAEALQLASARAPALALVDAALAEADPFELARQLRERTAPNPMQIVLVHEINDEPDVERCRAENLTLLCRPFDPEEVLALACEALHIDL